MVLQNELGQLRMVVALIHFILYYQHRELQP